MKAKTIISGFIAAVAAYWLLFGGIMRATPREQGFYEFEVEGTTRIETGESDRGLWLNKGKRLAELVVNGSWAKLDRKHLTFDDGSSPNIQPSTWDILPLGNDRYLLRCGRGVDLWRKGKSEFEFMEMNLGAREDGLWSDPDKKFSIVPFDFGSAFDAEENKPEAGNLLIRFELSDWRLIRHSLSAWTEIFPIPEGILIRNSDSFASTTTLSWSFLTPDFQTREIPLSLLLNRYRSTLHSIIDVKQNPTGWAILIHEPNPKLVYSPKTQRYTDSTTRLPTSLYLAMPPKPGFSGGVFPLLFLGEDPRVALDRKKLSLSPSGEYFLIQAERHDRNRIVPGRNAVDDVAVYLGRVWMVGDSLEVKLKHLGDFPSLGLSNALAWFPKSDGFAVLADDLEAEKSRIWTYSLEDHPIDWDSLPSALGKAMAEPEMEGRR